MLFDQEHLERQRAIDAAFAAGDRRGFERGYQRGRRTCDDHVMAEAVALRVELDQLQAQALRYQARAYRKGLETAFWFLVIVASIVVAAWVLL